ncbi:PKD domain-containing protein [Micromonospora sp. IBHARD004]|uniref:PKD domain-containing protein n=1 Tax=Micromonospora sp. IBHARD004 TaxID=3457764 RepID=UPI00405A3989
MSSSALLAALPARATTGDIGYLDQSFSGVSNPPTSDKPQSKLWYNDGLWWATMFDTVSKTWHIFRLDRSTGNAVDTGTPIDDRPQTLSDALWDGQKLYIASQWATVSSDSSIKKSVSGRPARLYRYSYDSSNKSYSLDSGYPVEINNYSSESLTLDKDSTGKLWATWTQVSGSPTSGYTSQVYVNSSQGSDSVWGTPMVLPVPGTSVAPDDISAVVAFKRSKIGVMWSNHLDDTMYWAVHNDGEPATKWHGSVVVRGPKQADDHLNLKAIQADQAGRVFATVKTSLDELPGSSPSDPQINLLVFKPGTASWSSTTVGTLADCHTRPVVMLDDENAKVYVFATAPTSSGCPYSGAPGTIYEKVAPIDNPVFSPGRGTPVIRDAASANMNNPTSSKQSVNSRTGLVVLASNMSTARYWHADLALAVPTASFTASPTSGTAPLSVQFTDTSTNSPTSWSWNFGNGTTSTQQNPMATYDSAGTYTVTLVASNSAGSSPAATTIITVSQASAGIVRAGTSTSAATTADTGLTITAPTAVSSGDLLVSCLAINGGSVTSVPAGWTSIAAATGVPNPHVYGYYKVAGASEPSSYRWGFSSSVTSGGGIARYTGASGLDVAASKASGASSSSGTVPGITTTTANAMLVGCMGINSGSTTVTITGPSGMSQAWDIGGKRQEYDDAVQSSAGATGDRTWQFSSERAWAGWLVALKAQ